MKRAGRGRPRQPLKARQSAKLTSWRRSPRCKQVALQALEIAREVQREMPKCGARTKGTGLPCRAIPMENGKCSRHGGKTPAGARWHVVQIERLQSATGLEKIERKLAKRAAEARQRERRISAMTPAEQEQHAKWQASHRPGSATGRAHRRQQIETGRMLAKLMANRIDVFE